VIYGDLSMNKGDLKQETIRNGDVHHVFLGDFMMISWWF
jgi:hypothetical protein